MVVSSKSYVLSQHWAQNCFNPRIPREDNQQADLLSKLARSNSVKFSIDVWVEFLEEPNVDKNEQVVIPINIIDD